MSANDDTTALGAAKLSSLERNRYFYGKLMTPRDMQAEQDYHRTRTNLLSRFVLGSGVVTGLGVRLEEQMPTGDGADERTRITVERGVAVDSGGRLLVVTDEVSEEIALDEDDATIHVSLEYGEMDVESVPTPDLGNAVSEKSESNRWIESPRVRLASFSERETESTVVGKPVTPTQGIDLRVDTDAGQGATEWTKLARSYPGPPTEIDDEGVFLGAFTREGSEWTFSAERRPLLYTNEMLYSLLIGHVYDAAAHNTSATVGSRLESRIAELESEVTQVLTRVEERERRFVSRVVNRSLKETKMVFDGLGSVYRNSSLRPTDERAKEVAAVADQFLDSSIDFTEFDVMVGRLLKRFVEFGEDEALRDANEISQRNKERYMDAVKNLETTMESLEMSDDPDLLDDVFELLEALELVNDRAKRLVKDERLVV